MNCEAHRDELILLLDPELAEDPERELSPAALGAIRGHVQGCSSCQDELIRLTLALEAAAVPAPQPAPLPATPASVGSSDPWGDPVALDPRQDSRPAARPRQPENRFRRSARAAALALALSESRGPLDDEAPKRLGEFEILSELGRGGMGIVYQARRSSGEEVALKVCLGLSERSRERRRRTIEAAGQVLTSQDAPRLAAPLEGFVLEHEGDEHWVEVMPLFRGPSLDDLLRQGRCDPQEATQIAVEVARAVREAHSVGLLLRDLKPQDVFLEAEGLRVLVPEPPFSASENRLTCTGAMLGTPYYLSPEQMMAKPCDGRSDVFALGAIYHHLLTGQPPNRGAETLAELCRDRIEGNLPEPQTPELGSDHKRVLARLLAADPERRYQDAEEALADLILISEELPLQGQGPSWDQAVRLHPPLLQSRASAITLVGLVAALAALIALLGWSVMGG